MLIKSGINKKKVGVKRDLFLMLDCETFGTFAAPVVYDLGMAVIDRYGKVYAKYSFVIDDTFYGMAEQAATAYYADKFPAYHNDIEMGRRKVITWEIARQVANTLIDRWGIRAVSAHNAKFDFTALNNTNKVLGYSGNFFIYNIEWWDTLSMVADTIAKQKLYMQYCKDNGYMTKNNKPRMTAEIVYRYIIGNNTFVECHTGLEDVLIEKEIFASCMRQHKKMEKGFFNYSRR